MTRSQIFLEAERQLSRRLSDAPIHFAGVASGLESYRTSTANVRRPRATPDRIMRTSPVAAMIKTVARKKNIGNGTPLRKPRGLLKAFTPPATSTSASPIATVSAATLIPRVHDDMGRTVVSAVP